MDNDLIEKIEDNISDTLEGFSNDLDEIFKTFTDKPFKSTHIKTKLITGSEFLSAEDNSKAVILNLDSDDEIKGNIFVTFSFKEVCTISGLVNGLSESSIKEKLESGNYDDNDIDTVSEIANQVASKLNNSFNPSTKKKIHLVKTEHIINGDGEEGKSNPVESDTQYFSTNFSVTLEGKELGFVFILMPLEISAEIAGVSEEGTEKSESTSPGKIKKIIVLAKELDSESESSYSEAANNMKAEMVSCPLESNIDENSELKEADIIFVDFEEDPEKGISICKELISASGKSKKIILSSKNITKEILMQALSTGVSDIIVKPASSETILKKVKMNAE